MSDTNPSETALARSYFLDWEFSEDGYVLDPISLGLVCEDGRELYLELEFDENSVNPWVRQNVLPLLTWPRDQRVSKGRARDLVRQFVLHPNPTFWGYYADYDWVLFARLFGPMANLPDGWPMMCMDLQQWWLQLGQPPYAKPPQPVKQHNALADARWNLELWRRLNSIVVPHLAEQA